jgi:hypothetical protein
MLKLVVDYYKILSAKEEKLDILLMDFFRKLDDLWLMRRKMPCLMLLSGRKRGREQGVSVWVIYAEGAPRPDGFSFLYYQNVWEVINLDLINFFKDFDDNKADVYRLNFSLVGHKFQKRLITTPN